MAIATSKYVDTTAGVAARNYFARRNLSGRYFTRNPRLAAEEVRMFSNATEVMSFFGKDSDEYRIAISYFAFISKSITCAHFLSFARWGDGTETPVEALVRVNDADDEFGSFAFVEDLTPAEKGAVARQNATWNYRYLYSVQTSKGDCASVLKAIGGVPCVCVTLNKAGEHAELMPMSMFAATDYGRVNTTKNFMFNQFDGVSATVTTLAAAQMYDDFDVDGHGTRYPVNYYGVTRQAGSNVYFYQDGFNADGVDTAVCCNEIWLKDALTVEFLNLLLTQERIPANAVGAAMCESAVVSVIGEALRNGTITQSKDITVQQKMYVDRTAGVEGAWESVVNNGYWLSAKVKATTSGARTKHSVDYVFIYAKGDSIRKITGSDILI